MLYIVATPIGNLEDLTERAQGVLQRVEVVLCEDTRHSRILLQKIGSNAKTLSFHVHSNTNREQEILRLLEAGQDMALITDAGTPGIADPGGRIVELAHQHGVTVVAVPGPSSVTAALSVCGFNTDRFSFYGFLAKKKGHLTTLRQLRHEQVAAVFFESPHRIVKTLNDLHNEMGGTRRICVCRELTKQFEEVWMGTLDQARTRTWREQGEFVVVIEGLK